MSLDWVPEAGVSPRAGVEVSVGVGLVSGLVGPFLSLIIKDLELCPGPGSKVFFVRECGMVGDLERLKISRAQEGGGGNGEPCFYSG